MKTLLLLLFLGAPPLTNHEYRDHYAARGDSGRLVVLLTMDGCAPCRAMKATLDRQGIGYALVNYSRSPSLAYAIGKSSSTPELVVYERTNGDWQARRLVGSATDEVLTDFFSPKKASGAYDGSQRLPGPSHPLRNTMCGSRGCQMCVGIALNRNYGVSYQRLRGELGNDYRRWLTLWDNLNNGLPRGPSVDSPAIETGEAIELAPYGETPPEAVSALLRLSSLRAGDVFYELGSGTGYISLEAARRYGAQAVGIEIDHRLVEEARESASEQGLEGFVEFREGDVAVADLSEADIISMYLTPNVTTKLLPKLNRLRPGVKVFCFEFPLEGIEPNERTEINGRYLYQYTTPLRED